LLRELQRFYTSVVTSAFTGISLIGLVAVSVWFALARLTSESDPQAKRIRILLAIIQRLLNQPVDEVERLASAAIGQLSSDKGDKKRQRRLYILQSFALAVQREKDLFELIKAPKHISAYARIEWPASQNTTSMPSMALKDSIQLRSLAAAGTVHPHLRIIRNFAFSPSGKLLASASTDRTVSIFSLSVCTQFLSF
jgi:WD40 repeat protein